MLLSLRSNPQIYRYIYKIVIASFSLTTILYGSAYWKYSK